MLKKSRVFLSCMALAGAGFGAAAGFGAEEARAAEMIRPEDEALLADIFAPAGSAEVSGGRAAVRVGNSTRPRESCRLISENKYAARERSRRVK